MSGRDGPIGIFDSGMGGLTVMRALMEKLPGESFVYLGDTARLPYGTKSPETVARYAVQAARALTDRDVKLVVIACNTASAAALPILKAALAPTPVVGVIEPGAEAAVAAAKGRSVAILATEGTVLGGAYVRAIHAHAPDLEVIQQACPLFVSLAEEGLVAGEIAGMVARHYLSPVFAANEPSVVVLGCTHFPALAPTIRAVLARQKHAAFLVDSAATTAEAVAHLLESRELAATVGHSSRHQFLVTDAPERFARVGEIFLGRKPEPVELIDLKPDQ